MQTPNTEEKRTVIINVVYYSLFLLVFIFGTHITIKYLLPALYPFAIAYALSMFLNPIMHFLKRKIGLPKGLGAFLLVTAAVAIAFGISYLIINRAAHEIGRFSTWLTTLSSEEIQPFRRRIAELLERLPLIDSEKLLSYAENRLRSFLSDSLPGVTGALTMMTGLFTGILDFLLTFIITVVSCYYMTIDRAKISAFFYKLCPQSITKYFRTIRIEVFGTLAKYLKAYGVIIIITFTQLFVAFTVLRLNYALLLAVIISIIDILPILGTGIVLVPWSLVCLFVTQNYFLGIGLLISYVVIAIIRQIIEPKIVGNFIGLHPLATMVTMFAGLKLFGLFGMLLLPFAVLSIKNIMIKRDTAQLSDAV